jgi:hypothetical protein
MEGSQEQENALGVEQIDRALCEEASKNATSGSGTGNAPETNFCFSRIKGLVGYGPKATEQNGTEANDVKVGECYDRTAVKIEGEAFTEVKDAGNQNGEGDDARRAIAGEEFGEKEAEENGQYCRSGYDFGEVCDREAREKETIARCL